MVPKERGVGVRHAGPLPGALQPRSAPQPLKEGGWSSRALQVAAPLPQATCGGRTLKGEDSQGVLPTWPYPPRAPGINSPLPSSLLLRARKGWVDKVGLAEVGRSWSGPGEREERPTSRPRCRKRKRGLSGPEPALSRHLGLDAGPQETPAQNPTGVAVILGKPQHKLTLGASSLSLRVSLCSSPNFDQLPSFPPSERSRGSQPILLDLMLTVCNSKQGCLGSSQTLRFPREPLPITAIISPFNNTHPIKNSWKQEGRYAKLAWDTGLSEPSLNTRFLIPYPWKGGDQEVWPTHWPNVSPSPHLELLWEAAGGSRSSTN